MSISIEKQCKQRPLFIDFPIEETVFRIDEKNVPYMKMYTGDEFEINWKNEIFREAIQAGDEITKEEYDKK